MDAVVTTDLDQLKSWLDELQIAYYECDSCQALHLPHLQYINGIFDAKIDILEDVLVFTAIAELKPSAIVPLMANLSQINASSLFIKTFLEISDDNLPKLVLCQSLSVAVGISFNQFDFFLQKAEEQSAEVISEIFNNGFLYGERQETEDSDDGDVEDEEIDINVSSTDSAYTVH
ncbi:MAG TPA: YbjN domain-containing protein [Proteus sp.]|uniref:YbjN domain-containing protein n=1 Tax=Proteus hauseri TaxID=183417 RepID=UPI000ECEF111|nr:YbjN domain-containing protein [Proteus hauseri]QAV24178.1 YbjN domain-containing protein [Proteus hauseri]HCH51242.1 YbjN domain-containing protein [Proteus sp. (in: enterobacteria)]